MGKINIKTIDFDIRDNRLMVSLGPLTSRKLCTFSCAFCYTFSKEFVPFNGLTVSEILDWITMHQKNYETIYVSGDTDNFAPPREEEGLDLLNELSNLKKDILFTTRAKLSEEALVRLGEIREKLKQNGKNLIGCVSISQLNNPQLEPWPIPTPDERILQLKRFKEMGLVAVLAIRPFLPVVKVADYIEIVRRSAPFTDIVLGGDWYVDKTGVLEARVFKDRPHLLTYTDGKMDFMENEAVWHIYHDPERLAAVEKYCQELNLPFFMRSALAISWIRKSGKD